MGIITTIPTNLDFPNRGVLERDDFVNAQETAQDLLAGVYTTALNQYATELNNTEADINLKWEQVQNQAVTGGYSQAYIDATFTPKILNTQTEKATPIDADLIPLSDSASSFSLKKLTWANLKATLKTYFDTLYFALTGNQTVAGVKTFSSNIVGNITGNATTATNFVNSTYGITNSISAGTGDGATRTTYNIKFKSWWGTAYADYADTVNRVLDHRTGIFYSASGSSFLPEYACRAWVNFNGTGTVAIRASGNISSITDDGVGTYTINFTTAMSDVNYSFLGYARDYDADGIGLIVSSASNQSKSTSSMGITSFYSAKTDSPEINIAVFR